MNQLKKIREEKDMSISELARTSGVSRQTIYRLEMEETKTANTKTLKTLANVLDVQVTDFFDE